MDKYFFVCDDKINDMLVHEIGGQTMVILACNDSSIKAINDKGQLVL